ncbi:MAG: DUF5362 domain-containing protein [Bacillota bacterium]
MDSYQINEPRSDIDLIKDRKLSGWATFVGIFTIIYGALSCIGIITAIIGVPMIIAGLKLVGAVDSMRAFSETSDINKLSETFDKLNSFFKIYGIISVVSIILGILMFIGLVVLGLFASGANPYGY